MESGRPHHVLDRTRAEQVSPPSYDLVCQVQARWSYGDQDPDVMEFWWKGAVVPRPRRVGAGASRVGKAAFPELRSVSLIFPTFQSSR